MHHDKYILHTNRRGLEGVVQAIIGSFYWYLQGVTEENFGKFKLSFPASRQKFKPSDAGSLTP
jgi:hypothetical protein